MRFTSALVGNLRVTLSCATSLIVTGIQSYAVHMPSRIGLGESGSCRGLQAYLTPAFGCGIRYSLEDMGRESEPKTSSWALWALL